MIKRNEVQVGQRWVARAPSGGHVITVKITDVKQVRASYAGHTAWRAWATNERTGRTVIFKSAAKLVRLLPEVT